MQLCSRMVNVINDFIVLNWDRRDYLKGYKERKKIWHTCKMPNFGNHNHDTPFYTVSFMLSNQITLTPRPLELGSSNEFSNKFQ